MGDIPLAELSREDIAGVFRAVDEGTLGSGRRLSPASVRRLYATLRSALNAAVKRQHLPHNPALLLDLAPASRPKALVWTEERVAEWQRTGRRPSPVMVWTPAQTGHFLDSSEDDPLYALFHLIALRGLRRGEACALSWSDLDLQSCTLFVREQLVQVGWRTIRSAPKASSERIVALDDGTAEVLREHRRRQRELCDFTGTDPDAVTAMFLHPVGGALHPDFVSRQFGRLVQEMFGHSSITITADTYTSVLPQVARAAAQSAAALVPRRSRETSPPLGGAPDGSAASR